jgi:2-polyprenyl-3-methyl-5-hydroxy-6-metoxy-1,4-benzoquinol methylase
MDAQSWDKRYADSDLVWSADPNQFFAAELFDLPAGRALDLGAGEGRNAMWLANHGWEVTAVDFSAVAIDKARAIAESRDLSVNWVVADISDYVPDAGSFDLVALVYIHLQPAVHDHVLRGAATALAPGGTLLVIGHDRTNIAEGVGGPQDPSVLFTPDEVVADLEGLEVVRAERVYRTVATSGGDQVAIDALIRATRPLS